MDEVDLEAVAKYVTSLQQPDGSFFGDKWGEIDTRFSFCAVAILSLIVSISLFTTKLTNRSKFLQCKIYIREISVILSGETLLCPLQCNFLIIVPQFNLLEVDWK